MSKAVSFRAAYFLINKYFIMKKILVLILAVMPVFLFAQIEQSSCPQKTGITISYSKDGLKTVKDVISVSVCTEQVIFVVSKTAYQTFYKLNGGQWVDGATDKLVKTYEKEGTTYFIKSEKKFFGYNKEKDVQ